MPRKRAHRPAWLLFPILAAATSPLCAQYTGWTNLGEGDWNVAGNWHNGVPNSGVWAVISNSGTATLNNAHGEASDLTLGAAGTGTLKIENGGSLTTEYFYLGYNSNTDVGVLTVTGANSILSLTSTISSNIANAGSGTLNILDGAMVTGRNFSVADREDSIGDVLLSGSGSKWTVTGIANLGYRGTGTLTVSAGGILESVYDISLATLNTAKGTLEIGDGAEAGTILAPSFTGGDGTAEVIFSQTDASYTFAPNLRGSLKVTHSSTGTTILTGANTYTGTTNIDAGTLQIGNGGTSGTLGSGNVVNNSVLTFNRSDSITIDNLISGTGQLVQSGSGTLILTGTNSYSGGTTINSGTLQIGNGDTTGSIVGDVANGSAIAFNRSDAVTFSGAISGTGSLVQSGSGTLILTGNNTHSGGTTISSGTLQLGNGGYTGIIAGDVVNNGALVFNRADTVFFGGAISGTGAFVKLGDASLVLTGSNSYIGTTRVATGTLVLDNNYALSRTTAVTVDAGAVLDLKGMMRVVSVGSIAGSGYIDASETLQGFSWGSDNTDTVWAGTIANGFLVTKQGTGTTTLTGSNSLSMFAVAGGTVKIGAGGSLGSNTSLSVLEGTLDLDGNNLSVRSLIGGDDVVIKLGSGTLTVFASNGEIYSGSITGTGGLTKSGTGTLILGGSNSYTGVTTLNSGTLQIGTGGTNGTLTGDVTNSGALVFKRSDSSIYGGAVSGTGSLTQSGSGTLILTGSNSCAGNTIIQSGTLQVGNGGTMGTLGSGGVANDGTLAFNRSDSFTFDNIISGSGGLVQSGSGTTILTATNTYTGATDVKAGTLRVNGALTSSTLLTVHDGGTLGGSGTITGAVNVLSGGNLSAGNSPGTLTVGSLTLNSGSVSNFELGSSSDLIAVSGNLTIGGILNLSNSGGFANTSYSLFTYGGTLTNNYFELNLVPGGWNRANFAIDLSTAGSVKLLVDNTVTIQYWDGSSNLDGSMSGGNGTWSSTGINWTNSNGSLNTNWQGVVGVFGGTAGTVAVADDVSFSQLQFETDGYQLTNGGGSLVTGGSFSELWTGTDVSAEIAASITGTSGLRKTGEGTLVLTSSNSYSGGTTIANGTVRTENSNAFGTGDVTLQSLGTLELAGKLSVGGDFVWDGGVISISQGDTDRIEIAGNFIKGSNSEPFVFSLASSGFNINQTYTLLTFDDYVGFDFSDFSATAFYGIMPLFAFVDNTLTIHYTGATSGSVLQNSGPIFTPLDANFLVSGTVTTQGPLESNTVNSLLFEDESSLDVSNTLTVTSGNFTVIDGRATLTGDEVKTPGDFHKLGEGILVTDVNLNVDGEGTIEAGGLIVNGELATGSGLVVYQNALLGGSGVIDGNVVNHGILSPGNSPGTLTVIGNHTQTSSSVFLMEIAGKNDFDRLLVSGTATLAGSLAVTPYDGYKLEYGQKFTVVNAGKIVGEFDDVDLSSGLRGRVLLKPRKATLLVAPESYTQVAQTPNQKTTAKALDSFIDADEGDRETVSIALDELKASEFPDAFDQIAPTFYESLARITIEQSNAQGQMLQQRFGALRLGGGGFRQVGLDAPIITEGKQFKELKETRNIMEPAADNPWGIWVQGNGLFAKNSGLNGVPNFRFDSGGFLLGADYRWNSALATGIYAGYQRIDARYDGGSRTNVNAARFGAYATLDSGNGFYGNALVGGGYSDYEVRRTIDFGSIDRTARSNPHGGEFSAMLGTGYDWKAGNLTFGPVASGQYTYVNIDGVTEEGARSLNLKVNDQEAHSLRSTLGARIAYCWQINEGVALVPEGRVTWQHEFLQDSRDIGAALDGGRGPGFNVVTTTPERDAVFAGVGLNLQVGERWNANVYYNADFGRGDFRSQMISGGLNLRF